MAFFFTLEPLVQAWIIWCLTLRCSLRHYIYALAAFFTSLLMHSYPILMVFSLDMYVCVDCIITHIVLIVTYEFQMWLSINYIPSFLQDLSLLPVVSSTSTRQRHGLIILYRWKRLTSPYTLRRSGGLYVHKLRAGWCSDIPCSGNLFWVSILWEIVKIYDTWI